MGNTTIQWTDKTWSPIRARVKENAHEIALLHGWKDLAEITLKMAGHVGPHCEMYSSGCNHCYSLTNNARRLPNNGTGLPFDKRSRELVDIFVDEKILEQPLHWRTPKKVFVENQSDLFGDFVPFDYIDKVFLVMAACQKHSFQILTKRARRMLNYCGTQATARRLIRYGTNIVTNVPELQMRVGSDGGPGDGIVLPNAWLGVSVEDQTTADERIPLLLQTPAAKRFISYEPALGPIDFSRFFYVGPEGGMDYAYSPSQLMAWLICGGESGRGARVMDFAWARSARDQCKAARVAFFMKQFGRLPIVNELIYKLDIDPGHGGDMTEWPEDLRVREFPE